MIVPGRVITRRDPSGRTDRTARAVPGVTLAQRTALARQLLSVAMRDEQRVAIAQSGVDLPQLNTTRQASVASATINVCNAGLWMALHLGKPASVAASIGNMTGRGAELAMDRNRAKGSTMDSRPYQTDHANVNAAVAIRNIDEARIRDRGRA
jgi:hypothetical protein